MLTVRCDSCGEEQGTEGKTAIDKLVAPTWYEIQAWPSGDQQMPYRKGQVCKICCEDFLSGKMYADATTEKV